MNLKSKSNFRTTTINWHNYELEKASFYLNGWDVRQGTYLQDVVAAKYDGGMDAKFEFTESGLAIFSGNMMEPWLNSSLHIRFTGGLQRLFSEYSE